MDAYTYPLGNILRQERRYIIPTFQRDYEWTRDAQWSFLFDDLASAADRLLEFNLDQRGGRQEKEISPHFMGAIVCGSLPFRGGEITPRSVIDGQQRLTTLQLLARGLLDVLDETQAKQAKGVRRMLFNPDDAVSAPEERYKLWPRRRDRQVWPTAMADSPPEGVTRESHLYLQARDYFASEVRKYAFSDRQDAVGSLEARLEALSGALSRLFKIVVIDLDDNDDAQVIFEVLNARQTPLSASDLVKNLLFLRGEFSNEDVELLYDKYWSQFDDPWWKERVGRGHAARERRDGLLAVWMTVAMCKEVNVGHLYREARSYLNDGVSTEDALKELDSLSKAYQEIYGLKEVADAKVARSYSRIRTLDVATAVPLLAWLRTMPSQVLSGEDHSTAVSAIESWIVRRVYVKAQSRGYGSHFARVIRAAKDAEAQGCSLVEAIVNGLDSGSLTWPTDEDLKNSFLNTRFYGTGGHSQLRIRMLLSEIDRQKRSMDKMQPFASIKYDELEIEHVMPVGWTGEWPCVDGEGNAIVPGSLEWEEAKGRRERAVNRVGNLTLVTGAFNRAVSNSGWSVKRPEFAKQRTLMINDDIAAAELWDEAHIEARARVLAELSALIWPSKDELLRRLGACEV